MPVSFPHPLHSISNKSDRPADREPEGHGAGREEGFSGIKPLPTCTEHLFGGEGAGGGAGASPPGNSPADARARKWSGTATDGLLKSNASLLPTSSQQGGKRLSVRAGWREAEVIVERTIHYHSVQN